MGSDNHQTARPLDLAAPLRTTQGRGVYCVDRIVGRPLSKYNGYYVFAWLKDRPSPASTKANCLIADEYGRDVNGEQLIVNGGDRSHLQLVPR